MRGVLAQEGREAGEGDEAGHSEATGTRQDRRPKGKEGMREFWGPGPLVMKAGYTADRMPRSGSRLHSCPGRPRQGKSGSP